MPESSTPGSVVEITPEMIKAGVAIFDAWDERIGLTSDNPITGVDELSVQELLESVARTWGLRVTLLHG
jgi:hypothetical protein